MADVDKSTLQELDLDKAFEGSVDTKDETTDTKSAKQTVEVDEKAFLKDMSTDEKPEKDVETETSQEVKKPTVEELQAEVERLSLAYKESSKEGREAAQLRKELAEAKRKVEVYDQIVADPQLENMIVDYWKGGQKQPSGDLKEKLGLGEDFVFDPDDITKPGTDSYKVFKESVRLAAKEMIHEELSQQQKMEETRSRKAKIEQMRQDYIAKYGEDDLEETISFVNNNAFDLEAARKLRTLGDRDKTIAKNAATEQAAQVKRNQEREPSLATAKGTKVQETDERTMIDFLKKVGGGDFSFSI